MTASQADATPPTAGALNRNDLTPLILCAAFTGAYALILLSMWHGWQPINPDPEPAPRSLSRTRQCSWPAGTNGL